MHPPALTLGPLARAARFLGRNWARVGYAYHVEPTWLAVTRLTLPVRDLPPALAGLTVAHLSDFHCGRHIPAGYLEGAVERAAAARPDLVALTGDFVDRGPEHVGRAARLFRHLRAPLGVFAVLGNHDFAVHTARGSRRHPDLDRRVAGALEAEGVTVLRNRGVEVGRGGRLVVAGVDDLWSGAADPCAALG
ncbi:MAG: metallophosphoesterase, partial [Gemmataceae bacterium]|nr:metallophosphoesterase [Gemmataceae bacterium]